MFISHWGDQEWFMGEEETAPLFLSNQRVKLVVDFSEYS